MSEKNIIICPVCKQVVANYDESEIDYCKHVVAVYVGAAGGFDMVKGKKMEKLTEKWLADEDGDIGELMEEYAKKNGLKFETNTTSGMCCVPVSFTDYYLFKGK